MPKPTVDIGIPAFNEEKTIGRVVSSLLSQKTDNFIIRQIIVVSDGSTDKTASIIKGFGDPRVRLVDHWDRKGNAARQNEIAGMAEADVLVIANADILIKDCLFLEKLVRPVLAGQADLVSPALEELPPRSFFEKVLALSRGIKKRAYENFREGDNILNCHGAARAFSKPLYRKIRFPEAVGEDAYSYLFCRYHGFKYLYLPLAVCCFRLPDNFSDHCRQSLRYFSTKSVMESFFPKTFVAEAYNFPKKLLLKSISYYILKRPIHCLVYIFCLIVLKTRSLFPCRVSRTWEVVRSSKSVYG